MLRELGSKLSEILALAPISLSAGANGITVDTKGLNSVLFLFAVGALTAPDGSNYMTLKVQESDDNSSWSDYSTVKNLTAAGDADKVYAAVYGGTKRYCRVAVAETGTAVAVIGAVAVGGLNRQT